jgi:hypothetical protein
MIFLNTILPLLLGLAVVLLTCWNIRSDQKQVSAEDELIELATPNKESADDSWEREWLAAMRRNHHVLEIRPAKIKFKFIKTEDEKGLHDGFKVVCSCDSQCAGVEILGLDLRMARRSYEKHLRQEGEKALAAIGKFDMPAGVSWELEAKKGISND